MNKELIEKIALEVAKEVTPEFVWEEGCDHEGGVHKHELYEFAILLLSRIDNERGKDAVAWVEVIDRHEGPYNFNGKELLDPGKHDLFISPTPTIPEGMCLVPVEPTAEMLTAACQDGISVDGKPVWKHNVEFQAKWKYKEMLAAAQGELK